MSLVFIEAQKMKTQKNEAAYLPLPTFDLEGYRMGPSGSEQCRAIANKVNFKLDEGCCLRWTKSIF